MAKQEDNIRTALENKNVSQRTKELDKVEKFLKRNDFTQKEIDKKIATVKGFVKKDRYVERVRGALLMADEDKREKYTNELRQEMREDNLNFTEGAIDSLFASEIKSLAFEGFITKAEIEKFDTFKLRDKIKDSIKSYDTKSLESIKKDLISAGRTKKEIASTIKSAKDEVIRDKYYKKIEAAIINNKGGDLNKIVYEMNNDKLGINRKGIKTRISGIRKKLKG